PPLLHPLREPVLDSIRVLVADDHELVKQALVALLEQDPAIDTVWQVSTVSEAIDGVVRHRPDVLILDIEFPPSAHSGIQMDVFHAAEEIRRLNPSTRIVIISGKSDDYYIESALRVDARGYVSKSDSPEHVVNAVHSVVRGKGYFSPTILERIKVVRNGARKVRSELLTEREWDTLGYLAEGNSKKEIAQLLGVSVKTVEKHTQSIMDKVDIHDRVKLSNWFNREKEMGH
ncbi:MAG: response regulator transcription factor, partial [Planctomycetota bacterium]|nr:response regulator transcription factor [Planctomycetota bacterium]